ncbi:hypothetical protein [Mycobacterium seoulense]|uniref:hypothetical protein n=1 Tax=Mycobacterium seoulense TaxID=386911 RepID=UPI003CF630BA
MNEKTPIFRPALSTGYGDNVTHPGLAEWDRRRRAAKRVPPIDDEGTVDPWLRSVRPPLTRPQIDGAVAAAEHLLTQGLPPVFDIGVIRAMWKAGHRDLACDLWAIYADRWAA